jgi:hypothetical protein
MRTLLTLGAIGALLLAIVGPATAATRSDEIGYADYAYAKVANRRASLRAMSNESLAYYGGTEGFSNARYLAMSNINSSFSGANNTEVFALVAGAIALDGTSQGNLNTGFRDFGTNASAVICGRYDNATDTLSGDCSNYVGRNGTSALDRQTANILRQDFEGQAKPFARDWTVFIKSLMTEFVTRQKGRVAVLDNAQEVVT